MTVPNPRAGSTSTLDEIPEALRDTPLEPISRNRSTTLFFSILAAVLGLGAIALFGVIVWMRLMSPSDNLQTGIDQALTADGRTEAQGKSNSNFPTQGKTVTGKPDRALSSASGEGQEVRASLDQNNLLGHLPYAEAPIESLVSITPDGQWKLREAAANEFLAMQAAARADGVELVVISAFRTIADQQTLFFDIKAERGQDSRERAEVSAPPGYSEHHTGYAIDLGDATAPSANLSPDFEQTAAFQWLKENAAHYSFELSFPPNNEQGINYEPWHWRFVGDQDSLETFYRAHSLTMPSDQVSRQSSDPSSNSSDPQSSEINREISGEVSGEVPSEITSDRPPTTESNE